MQGRAFLDLAQEILRGGTEVHFRGAAGRAYYALLMECKDALARWGFPMPPHETVHRFVRLRFAFPADADLKTISVTLDRLSQLRNLADYELRPLAHFATARRARIAIQDALDALKLLDAIDGDPSRRAAATQAVKNAFP